jgi:hypothetical protein
MSPFFVIFAFTIYCARNQKVKIVEQKTQWPKEKGQNNDDPQNNM